MENQGTSFRFTTVFLVILWVTAVFSLDLKIEPSGRNLLVPQGNKTVLDCYVTVESEMSPSILSWACSSCNNQLTTNTRTDIADSTYTYHNLLTIESFTDDDEGKYTCRLNSGSGNLVEANIELFTVIENKNDLEFFYGNKSAILECTLGFTNKELKATFIEWLKDGTPISNLKLPERFNDYKNGTLVITNPARSDAGQYYAYYKAEIGNEVFYHACIVTYIAAPLVLDMSKSKNVENGDTLTLECKVKGYPPANVTWLKDNETLREDDTHVIMDTPPDYELIIHSVSYSDEGLYTCVAVDRNGRRSSKKIFVRVKNPLEWLWPVIGIVCQIIVLAGIIFTCSKIKKDDHVEKPADEREGLLRQGSGRVRDQEKND